MLENNIKQCDLITDVCLKEDAITLMDMLESQLKYQADGYVVIDKEQSLNYADFYLKVKEIGYCLSEMSSKNSVSIGLFCDPSIDLICGAWGILSANKAYLPLSPDYPAERLKYMIEDSGIDVIFTQSHLKEQLQDIAPKSVLIITPEDVALTIKTRTIEDILNTARVPNPTSLAYIIYTSGSTGKPKGVMIEHHSIVNQMRFLAKAFSLGKHSRILQKTPMSFDAAQWEILAPAIGVQVIIGPVGCYRDPDAIIKTILQHQVTTLQCVPTLLQALLDNPNFLDCLSLTQVFSGGEALTTKLSAQFLNSFTHCELINLYGPTECTINSSYFRVTNETLPNYQTSISIGIPVDNTEYYVLDENRLPVVVGEIGELYISGVQLARGYLHKPEMTKDKFIYNHLASETKYPWLYRTGDLVTRGADGNTYFVGRVDSQVKLRGYRIELDEIRHAIEEHSWIKTAAMLIKKDARTGFQNLIACVELDEKEAALMDQGNSSSHHKSKTNKLQVKAQLSNSGCRSEELCENRPVILLPYKEGEIKQREYVFGRKTYRYFEGTEITVEKLKTLLTTTQQREICSLPLNHLTLKDFGYVLRYFGQFTSHQRLLPKYAYASPGALYATQMYFELHHVLGLDAGIYYYHPVTHELIKISTLSRRQKPMIKVHFIGKREAIEPVYKNNIQEVLKMEAGHMMGLFDDILPEIGLGIGESEYQAACPDWYDGNIQDYYLGAFEICRYENRLPPFDTDLYLQTHANKIPEMPCGLYHFSNGEFVRVSDDIVRKKDVIAINQQVYDRSSFGVSIIPRCVPEWHYYITLGRRLHALQSNQLCIGLMSSGYSSESNNDLPSAKRMRSILNALDKPMAAFYFCIGGSVSQEQYTCEGMKEDVVHMKGPVEIIKDDLHQQLPQYMIPNKVLVFDKLPLTANGKVDYPSLSKSKAVEDISTQRPLVPLRTETELRLGKIWMEVMKWDSVSAHDDFFESGGNSLMAVAMVNKINEAFNIRFPLQILFQSPNIEELAKWIEQADAKTISRLILLNQASKDPIYCWPGLGGYPMSLRLLANKVVPDRAFYGIQAYGINESEIPFSSIQRMAEEDIKEIKKIQPEGPYTLWGYSFGARVAFEAAYQLEQAGEEVKALNLLAPGSPHLHMKQEKYHDKGAEFTNPAFVQILFSVFARSISSPMVKTCLEQVNSEATFINFICSRFKNLEPSLVKRIVRIVTLTYDFKYSIDELYHRYLKAPITILKANKDNDSFIEKSGVFSSTPPKIIELISDHYQLLENEGVTEIEKIISLLNYQ
ncbi:amino acid adenylation enzyme/thioester reductase family protein [Photorhabdus khanii NC19]|uniref:Amino acid adenylation enzyme/thioester reductase family protein n=1 Tax=Photorhabdus khanii NC19 TaxID=1004151 RepID=W3V737_9GAMM|nr:amino acid adenylation domain-containing protein [Photorhabdus khanii]ETS30854.1 amino acid adenylation enzyme/thioester reductase family protein [Photorhabdus khanii NC19]